VGAVFGCKTDAVGQGAGGQGGQQRFPLFERMTRDMDVVT
jgi:hypothetical protein